MGAMTQPACEGKVASQATHLSAWVQRGRHDTPLLCKVIEMSSTSASIDAPDIALPNEFILLLTPDGAVSHRCKVVWWRAAMVGVTFETT
jgi:hypothetical protein